MDGISTGSGNPYKVNIDDIVVIDEFNVRDKDDDYFAEVRIIADSIKANGFLPSKHLLVFIAKINGVDKPALIDGHRRLDGVKLARSEGCEITTVPVSTTRAGTSMEDLTVALMVTNGGSKLKPNEVAKVCKRLVNMGMEVPEIAKRLVLTETYVKSLLELGAAPRAVRDLVAKGEVSATLAISTLKKHGAEAAQVLTKGVEAAKATGKSKVTKKSLEPVKVKAVKRDLLGEGAAYIAKIPLLGDHTDRAIELFGLLALMTGQTDKAVLARVTKARTPVNLELL